MPVTLGEIAKATDVPLWHLRRLFDRGLLGVAEPQRLGRIRLVREEEIEAVTAKVRELTAKK